MFTVFFFFKFKYLDVKLNIFFEVNSKVDRWFKFHNSVKFIYSLVYLKFVIRRFHNCVIE